MNTVRLNITLPGELALQLDDLAGHKKKSSFIAESLKDRIEKVQREQLQALLEEGYKARRQESFAMAGEFELVDLDGWEEY